MDYKRIETSIYLGVGNKDPKRLLSDFDELLEAGIPVFACDSPDLYLIRFPSLYSWITTLYCKDGGLVSGKIKETIFSLRTKEGGLIRELAENEQQNLRIGIDKTYRGTSRIRYEAQSMMNSGIYLTICLDSLYFNNIRLDDFQSALIAYYYPGADVKIDPNLKELVRAIHKDFRHVAYDMIYDMYNKGYIQLSSNTLKWWDEVKRLGV